jgi:cobalt/nickel transport system permease protein
MHPDIDKYAHIKSSIHRWDPRVKIFALFALIFTIATLYELPIIAASLGLCIILVLISRLPLSFVTKRLLPVTIFLLPFFIIIPLTMPGETSFKILAFSFNTDGLVIAARVYLKAISIVMLIITMMGTASFADSLKAMERLKIPPMIVQMILFTYRYIFVFLLEMRRMNRAMSARNFVKKTNTHTLKTIGNFVGVLLVRSFEKAEKIYQAMLSRGYDGVLKTFFDYQIVARDYVKGTLVILVCIMLFVGDKLI